MTSDWKTTLHENVKPEYFFWAAAVCSLFLMFGTPVTAAPETAAVMVGVQPSKENPYDALQLLAKAAYVYDVRIGKPLFARNESEVLPLASIAKIMTAATALSLIPETTYVTIDEEAVRTEGDSGIKVGERWLLRDLLKFMLIESSNDSAVAVSSTVGGIIATSTGTEESDRGLFVKKMNELVSAIGLGSTRFLNESGLDIDTAESGAYSSARETAVMLAYALRTFPEVFKETRWDELTLPSENGGKHSAENTNKEIRDLPLLIASKTGYTDLAGGNLVIAFDAGFNHPIIVAVLGSTIDGRFEDVKKLVWATLEALSQNL